MNDIDSNGETRGGDLPPDGAMYSGQTPPLDPGSAGLSFEEAFTRLKQVVADLESGNMTLEQATRHYEEGMKLAQTCNRFLSQTELKMTELRSIYLDDPTTPSSQAC